MDGVLPPAAPLQFTCGDTTICLRRARADDMAREDPMILGRPTGWPAAPTAVLNVDFLGRGATDIERKVAQSIAILRLFAVGSEKYILVRMRSDSIMDLSSLGEMRPAQQRPALTCAKIPDESAACLVEFWRQFERVLPERATRQGPSW